MTDEEKFDYIILEIERGNSLRQSIKGLSISTATFYKMLDEAEVNKKRYARACEERAEAIFEDILDISDNRGGDTFINSDGVEQIDHAVIQRDRLRVDARKWALAKMMPKKYGDKIDVTSDGEKISSPILSFDPFDNATNDSTSEDSVS